MIHYLLYRGLLQSADIVSGAPVVYNEGRRNRNFRVSHNGGGRLFVKQVPGVFTETTSSIFREATCNDLAHTHPAFGALKPYVPMLLDYDHERHVVTNICLPPSSDLNAFHVRARSFRSDVAAVFGRALGEIHSIPIDPDAEYAQAFPGIVPWILTIPQDAEKVFHNMNPSTRSLVTLIRSNPVLVMGLTTLNATWRTEALIHGDIKWDNFLVFDTAAAPLSAPDIRIVDWELADVGDAAWDIGCAIACYLQHWLVTMVADNSPLGTADLLKQAPYQLSDTWPAIQALWTSYSSARSLSPSLEVRERDRALQFCAARLVLTAFEITMRLPDLSRTTQLCLEMATTIFGHPEYAFTAVFGFPRVKGRVA